MKYEPRAAASHDRTQINVSSQGRANLSALSRIAILVIAVSAPASVNAADLLGGFGGDRGFGTEFLPPNDDGSSASLALPFEIDYFGQRFSQFFVNNNGNITFNSPLSGYTPSPFPVTNQPMIAPWWADVDTFGVGDGIANRVWVNSPNASTVVVTWDQVGYFSARTDKSNSFQLVLLSRSDTGAGNFDAQFRYQQLEWTTGNASGGIDGLGGIPAQAGWDAGDGVHFQTLPGSRTDEVLDLVNQSNVSTSTPGLWNFSFRNGNLPGGSPETALMPVITEEGWRFFFNVTPNQLVFIDPEVAIGYDYVVNSGPSFASVLLPDVGDGRYDLLLWDGAEWADSGDDILAGQQYAFSTPLTRFRIAGIETEAALDPSDTTAFVTGLTFTDAGQVDMLQIPITTTVPVPEPETYALFLAGLGALAVSARRRHKV
jgi:hypothetical protein